MVRVGNSEIITAKFNIVWISITINYKWKWIYKLYRYTFIDPLKHTIRTEAFSEN